MCRARSLHKCQMPEGGAVPRGLQSWRYFSFFIFFFFFFYLYFFSLFCFLHVLAALWGVIKITPEGRGGRRGQAEKKQMFMLPTRFDVNTVWTCMVCRGGEQEGRLAGHGGRGLETVWVLPGFWFRGRGFLHDELWRTLTFRFVSFSSCLWLATPPLPHASSWSSSSLAISVNFLSDNLNAQMCENSSHKGERETPQETEKTLHENSTAGGDGVGLCHM